MMVEIDRERSEAGGRKTTAAAHFEPSISVVVATRNRSGSLGACLESILASDYPSFELLVVDQSDDDASEKIVSGLGDARVKFLRQKGITGKERALNAAIRAVSADVIAFTDDDCTVPADWLSVAMRTLEAEPKAGVIYGAVVAAPHDPDEQFVPVFEPKEYRRIHGRFARAHRSGMGANMVVRRRVFAEVNGFEQTLGPGGIYRSGGDWEISYRALRSGFDVIQAPNLVVTHFGARKYGNGEVRRLIANNYFGIGAGYGIHAKHGDVVAAGTVVVEAGYTIAAMAANLVRARPPLGFRRFYSLVFGFCTALLAADPADMNGPDFDTPTVEEAVRGPTTRITGL